MLLYCASLPVLANADSSNIYQPDGERIIVHEADINALDVQLGIYAGLLSVQDFGSSTVSGIAAAFHVSEDFFLHASLGQSRLKKTSFEKLNPGFSLLSDDDRDYRYYTLGIGYNLFQGESFIASHAFNSAFYLTLAAGSTRFAGDQHHSLIWGFGYRIIWLDWLASHIEARDHVFDSDVFADDERFHSVELTTGLSVFF
ncbi:MAG TPA: outer membrane beta-barrel domain-containing protein [Pseudomonadales bacterium]